MTNLLIVGNAFTEEERARLSGAHAAALVASPSDIAGMDMTLRTEVRAVAFKGHAPFGAEAMQALPNLGLIANFGVGYDAIDVTAATARSVAVTNTPDVLNDDVADLAVGMMLAQARDMVRGHLVVASGKWPEGNLPLNRKMSGGKVGIVGLGRIGREIANRLAAFKMDIHYTSRSEKETPGWTYHADLKAMAQAVDWLVVALVGGPETEGHVSREVLEALGPQGVLVNISRGTTVDEAAMLDLLESGKLGGAALDVFLNEPDVDPRFRRLNTVHLQPHQGSGTVETRRAMAELQLANIDAFLAGKDLVTPVN
ncbi:2-hydroxyacid dehydrogenase [Sagittula salina]|uniref:2-hydroxyacid dehydrogenase n=1 Tax=Sagittula salina TaxID=2820268 RepID=A0A940S224_9RHOB|nr:2-hydroxyacid dehydrogenase [Sagittula salina]MBP0481175.1 2-hydroxyacid dehydrogenase [Sagittula salina]